jgi:N-acetylglucosaminyl-diphospho-decaprenol L-rhamnosyltransferase
MDLSIIIVNWNSADYVKRCISTIYGQTNDIEFEIIVVDNASFDNCQSMLASNFPKVSFIQGEDNIGFGNANNLGFYYSSGDVILFLNPDTEILDKAINIVYEKLLCLPEAGAMGCKLLNSDLSLQTSCIQAFPTILNQVLDSEFLRRLFPKSRLWGVKSLYVDSGQPQQVDTVSGAFVMVRRNVFQGAGLFSKDYFMYSEDVDLCYKIKREGYKVYFESAARVIHHGGGSSSGKGSVSSVPLMKQSRFIYFRKAKGPVFAEFYRIAMFFDSIFRILSVLVLFPFRKYLWHRRTPTYSLRKWKKILRWSLGLEDWNR